jgi:glycosyltransferase involved in cell wall biosynthesis
VAAGDWAPVVRHEKSTMGEAILASIIISSYNYGRFLKDAIDSALNQTYPNTEVIVVDDGSVDNSREIIARYGDRVLPVLKANGGQASAFNAGFRASRGEVISFLDSDDMLVPTAVEKAVSLLRNDDAAKVHWPLWAADQQGKKTGQVIPAKALSEGDLQEVVIRSGPGNYVWPPTSGNAWARKFIERIFPMPEAEYITCPDLYLSALAPVFGPVKRVREPQGFWRIHGTNQTWREPFDEKLRVEVGRWEHCYEALSRALRDRGISADIQAWRANSWVHQIYRATQEIAALVPRGDNFILVDASQWAAGEVVAGRRCIPYLERDGQYWGAPPDDETALRELERLRQSGASFMAFGWPAFWWLDYYSGLHSHLRSAFPCVLQNDRLVVFDLRP